MKQQATINQRQHPHSAERHNRLQSVDIDLSDFVGGNNILVAMQHSTINSKTAKEIELQQQAAAEAAVAAAAAATETKSSCCCCCYNFRFGLDLAADIKRRLLSYYISDYIDGFKGKNTFSKVLATTVFLYFSILLPTIAFSSLNSAQTSDEIGNLRSAIIGQAIGGLVFAFFCGQPLVIIMTTAPLCLYTKVIHEICLDYELDFRAMYGAVGVTNAVFLSVYSLFGTSESLIKNCTRFVQEVFAMFIVCALILDACKDTVKNFSKNYFTQSCTNSSNSSATINATSAISSTQIADCHKEASLLYLFLLMATIWIGLSLYKLNKSSLFNSSTRTIVSSYALPIAIVLVSLVGKVLFGDIDVYNPISSTNNDGEHNDTFVFAQVGLLPIRGIVIACALGFTLSLLFLMDQNISAAMVDAPQNKLKKGTAYHLDILLVGLLNACLTMLGFPMMHGVLPHSPMHAKCLADIELVTKNGYTREIISNIRETRISAIFSHLAILASIFLLPVPLAYIPAPVLSGLFVYMALTSLDDLQMFARIKLLFTEKSEYPPSEYAIKCPVSKIHLFTMFQILMLVIMCAFGFSSVSFVKMFFPVLILLMIPVRQFVVAKCIDEQHLQTLDS